MGIIFESILNKNEEIVRKNILNSVNIAEGKKDIKEDIEKEEVEEYEEEE